MRCVIIFTGDVFFLFQLIWIHVRTLHADKEVDVYLNDMEAIHVSVHGT